MVQAVARAGNQLESEYKNMEREKLMIIVTGSIKLESTDELEGARQALISRAERSRADSGCIDYVFSQNLEDPTEIRLTEKWESTELLQAHLAIPDEEFSQLMSTAKISQAVVVSNEAGEDQVLMQR
jgi:quinol monooxygenase YgiN